MNALTLVAFLLAATCVLAQNPYEYVDDKLIQKVGQIVYEYDQKVAASRSAGGNSNNYNNNYQSGGDYQVSAPEPVARRVQNNNFNYGRSVVPQQQYQQPQYQRQQRQYNFNQAQHQRYVQQPQKQQQQVYQQVKPVVQSPYPVVQQQQRTYNAAPVARTYQAPQQPQVSSYKYEAPVESRKYQEPKNTKVFTGYTLSQPEVVARVAEWHFTDGEGQGQGQDSYQYKNNNQYGQVRRGVQQQQHTSGDFQLA
jgi:hypothetical protein